MKRTAKAKDAPQQQEPQAQAEQQEPQEQAEPKGFDAEEYIRRIAQSGPKQQYQPEQPEERPQEQQAKEPGKGAEPNDPGDPDRDKRRAKVYVAVWNRLTGSIGAVLAGDPDKYPAKMFELDADEQAEAAACLADGMKEGKVPTPPWYLPLVIIAAMQVIHGARIVREARGRRRDRPMTEAAEAQAAAERLRATAERARRNEVEQVEVDGIIHPDGTETKPPGICALPGCNEKVKKKGRIYCSYKHRGEHQSQKHASK